MTLGDLQDACDLIRMMEDPFANVIAGDEGDDEAVKSDEQNLAKCVRVRKAIQKFIKKASKKMGIEMWPGEKEKPVVDAKGWPEKTREQQEIDDSQAQLRAKDAAILQLVKDIEAALADRHLDQTALDIARDTSAIDPLSLTRVGHIASSLELIHASLQRFKKEMK